MPIREEPVKELRDATNALFEIIEETAEVINAPPLPLGELYQLGTWSVRTDLGGGCAR